LVEIAYERLYPAIWSDFKFVGLYFSLEVILPQRKKREKELKEKSKSKSEKRKEKSKTV